MSLNFYRRVAFGLSPNEKPDKDPLNWAINQLDTIPRPLKSINFGVRNLTG